jgi:hypothetical protein
MPEIITIIFDCYGMDSSIYSDPKMFDAPERCRDAEEALIDFLDDHHISYYSRWIENDELRVKETEFAKDGIGEYGG